MSAGFSIRVTRDNITPDVRRKLRKVEDPTPILMAMAGKTKSPPSCVLKSGPEIDRTHFAIFKQDAQAVLRKWVKPGRSRPTCEFHGTQASTLSRLPPSRSRCRSLDSHRDDEVGKQRHQRGRDDRGPQDSLGVQALI